MKLAIAIIILFLSSQLNAISPWYPPPRKATSKVFTELIIGSNSPWVNYTSAVYSGYQQAATIRPVAGIGFRHQTTKLIAIAAQVVYSGQGTKIKKQDDYTINANYFVFQVPVEFSIKRNEHNCCFASIAPYIGTPIMGKINSSYHSTSLSKSNISPIDYGFEIGGGYRFPAFSLSGKSYIRLKLAYFQGFVNSFSEFETSGEATAINQPFYKVWGERYNRGVRLTIAISFPMAEQKVSTFVAGGDSEHTYKKFVIQH